jgi:hypothetical protein
MGRAESPGGSQATAISWHSCSGVNVGGAPGRGASANTPRITAASARSSSGPPSTSAASSVSAAVAHRSRQACTVFRAKANCDAGPRLLAPSAAPKTMRARAATAWGVLAARTRCVSTRRWRAVTVIR